jgi:hypothetical protein
MLLTGVGAEAARVALETSGGNARVAVASLVTRA